MSTSLLLLAALAAKDASSNNLFERLRSDFAQGEWGNLVYSSTGTARGEWYGYTMNSYFADYNGNRWRILMNTDGFVGIKAERLNVLPDTALKYPSERLTSQASQYLERFWRSIITDIQWSYRFGIASNEAVDVLEFSARFRNLPILSKRIWGRVAWFRNSGEVVFFGAELRRPTSIINEGDPISPQIAALRMQPHLRNPERTLDPKKLILGWSVETNEGRTRLIYFYEAPPPGGLDRLAVDAVTGQLVEPPPYR